jgi:hypothetical protein
LRYGCDTTLVAIRELRAGGCEVRSA